MPIPLSDLLLGFILPALLTAIGVYWPMHYIEKLGAPAKNLWVSMTAGGSLLISLCAGYGFVKLAPWQPESHWHHFVYIASAAILIGAIANTWAGKSWPARGVLYLIVSGAAAVFLVPTWEDLSPSRSTYILLFALLTSALALAMEFAWNQDLRLEKEREDPAETEGQSEDQQVRSWELKLSLLATLVAMILMMFLSGSLRFTQLAMIPVSGIGALLLVGKHVGLFRASAFYLATSLISLLLIAEVNSFSEVPSFLYLLLGLAPLFALRFPGASNQPLARPKSWFRFATVAGILLIVLVWACLAEFASSSEY